MDTKTQLRYDARARIAKAMAHPTRLFVVDELSRRGERCVCELTEMVGVDISTISRHLAVLRDAGLVEDDKRGTQVYYHARVGCIASFLDCVDSMVECSAGNRKLRPRRRSA